jgi:hypothetical protein
VLSLCIRSETLSVSYDAPGEVSVVREGVDSGGQGLEHGGDGKLVSAVAGNNKARKEVKASSGEFRRSIIGAKRSTDEAGNDASEVWSPIAMRGEETFAKERQ